MRGELLGITQSWTGKNILRDSNGYFGVSQVCPGESSSGLLLAFLRCVDVWRHTVGDVYLLRGALVRSVRQTGKRMSVPRDH